MKAHSRWKALRSKAETAGEVCSVKNSEGSLPVCLKSIALERKVRDVVFRPLLIDACLGVRHDGFVIFVKCSKQRSTALTKAFESSPCSGYFLPNRTRFSIAHEIAHTFFFNLDSSPPASDVELRKTRSIDALETACNEIARRLLLPKALFLPELGKINVLNPQALRALARKAAVSTDVFTLRLNQLFDWTSILGGILCIREEVNGPKILSMSMHSALRPHFNHLARNSSLGSILSSKDFILNGGRKLEMPFEIPCQVGNRKAFQRVFFRCEDAPQNANSTRFVTFERQGDLQFADLV